MSSRRSFLHCIACCLFFLVQCICCPKTSYSANENNTIPLQEEHKINIGKISKEIRIHLDKIRTSGEQEVSVLDELEQIDDNLAKQKHKLATLQERLQGQKELLALKEQDQRQAEQVKENVRRHLEKRLRSFYLMGRAGVLNVTFSKKSLPELMLFNDSFKQLLEYDQSVIDMYHETIAKLKLATKAQELEKNILQDFVRQAKEEQQALDEIRGEKSRMLSRIRTEKGLYEQAVREMQQAEFELTNTLKALKEKEDNRIRGFFLNKGKMAGPVIGNLTVRFGDSLENGSSTGIIIDAAENSKVISIYAGKVIFAGYKRGYGNMVIIDHDLQYYTITARLDEIFIKEGDRVQSRQQIGTTGDLATLFSKGLYFEIRKGSEPLDPLDWLQENYYPKQIPLPPPSLPDAPEHIDSIEVLTKPSE